MFERFTDRARRVVVQAQEEARGRHHDRIDTTHLLLALTREGGVGSAVLEALGTGPQEVAQQARDLLEPDPADPDSQDGHIPFSPGAKEVLQLAFREAIELGHSYIGTEHILLGLIREQNGTAAKVLASFGVTLNRARQQVISEVGVPPPTPKASRLLRRLRRSG